MTYPGTGLYPGATTFPDGPDSDTFHFGPARWWSESTWFGDAPVPLGAGFLLDQLGASGRLIVEAAFGADLTADPSLWSWFDLSPDVRADDQIVCSLGRGDEAATSQPAKLALILDNRAGLYARGPSSRYWPGVRRGTPIRVRIRTGAETEPVETYTHLLWQGYADAWSPSWDGTAADATVELSASGTLRRLKQGDAPALSAMRRSLPTLSNLVAYWPCEDDKSSTSIAPGIDAHGPMAVAGRPAFAEYDTAKTFPASGDLPLVGDSTWVGAVPTYSATGKTQVQFALSMGDDGTWANPIGSLVTIHLAGGSWAKVAVQFYFDNLAAPDGALLFRGWTTGAVSPTLDSGYAGAVIERPQVVQVQLTQTTSSTWAWEMSYFYPGSDVFHRLTGTQSGTLGQVTRVTVGDRASGITGLATVGHLTVRNTTAPGFSHAYYGFSGEYADDRIARLCGEAGIPIEMVGSSQQRMGPQSADDVLALLRECETVDGGILHDGTGAGLRYVCRTVRESRTVTLTLDQVAGQVADADLVDDDAANRNSWTIKRRAGSSVTVTDEDGPLGVAAIGLYDDSATLALDSDTRIVDHAGWGVHLGTSEGYRLPRLGINLAAHPELAAQVLALGPSSRIDLTNVNSRRTQLDDATISLLTEGWSAKIDQNRWQVTVNTSPAAPWRVGHLAAETGAPSAGELRAATDGSAVQTKALAGATSLTVSTPTGPIWTTAAGDYPMTLDVGGRAVVATACTGSSAVQTFTVAALSTEVPPGTPVDLWQSPVLGL
jgi:hypothetical protein